MYDVLGDVRQPNLPGTSDEYPNWRMPLTSSLEEIVMNPQFKKIAEALGSKDREASAGR
jgi:4-alpha-glucanotransferase